MASKLYWLIMVLVRNELSGSIMNKPHSWYAGIDYGEVGGKLHIIRILYQARVY